MQNSEKSLPYSENEACRHMRQGSHLPETHEEVIELMEESKKLSTDSDATPMSLERARSINLELARVFLHWAGNLEHVIWEMGGHRSLRYNPGLDPKNCADV